MVSDYCSVSNCKNTKGQKPALSFFRFPKVKANNPSSYERCKQWLINTGREDLFEFLEKDPNYLYYSCRICAEHFEDHDFKNIHRKNALNINVIPTVFKKPVKKKSLVVYQKRNLRGQEGSFINSKDAAYGSEKMSSAKVCRPARQKTVRLKSTRYCSAPNCYSYLGKAGVSFFTFPKDEERCKKWVKNCQRHDLIDKPAIYCHENHRLCGKHFTDNQFMNSLKNKLVWNAVPTVFRKSDSRLESVPRKQRLKDLLKSDEGEADILEAADDTKEHTSQISKLQNPAECCAVMNCPNFRGCEPEVYFFSFPNNSDRCKLWIRNCQRTDLQGKSPLVLSSCYFLCSEHFEDVQFQRQDRKQLISDAVPTLFHDSKTADTHSGYGRGLAPSDVGLKTELDHTYTNETEACSVSDNIDGINVELTEVKGTESYFSQDIVDDSSLSETGGSGKALKGGTVIKEEDFGAFMGTGSDTIGEETDSDTEHAQYCFSVKRDTRVGEKSKCSLKTEYNGGPLVEKQSSPVFHWTQEMTRTIIGIYKQNLKKLEQNLLPSRNMCKLLTDTLTRKGIQVSENVVYKKWNHLFSVYKHLKVKTMKMELNEEYFVKPNWRYYEDFDQIYGRHFVKSSDISGNNSGKILIRTTFPPVGEQ